MKYFSRCSTPFSGRRPLRLILLIAALLTLSTTTAAGEPQENYEPSTTVKAVLSTIMDVYPAVGTVKPKSETLISSQIGAQVKKLHVKAGDTIKKGDLLATLDNRQLAARLGSSRQALSAAKAGREKAFQNVKSSQAALDNARLQYERIKSYFESEAATRQEFENAESSFLQAKAGVSMAKEALAQAEAGIRQAREAVKDSSVGFEFSRLTAPSNGEVIRVMVEPGDLAMPGKPLVALRTESGFRIEAHVREGLIDQVKPGTRLKARIPALDHPIDAEIEEIITYADPDTRTFLIKATIPLIDGIYPGMYAKLQVPHSQVQVVMIPFRAVIRTGQLELVMVKTDDFWQRRFVKTGKSHGNMIEILSGISDSEIIGIGGSNHGGD